MQLPRLLTLKQQNRLRDSLLHDTERPGYGFT